MLLSNNVSNDLQVSHHPPASALHVEHKDWIFWQEFTCTSKFRGKYLQVIPHGVAHLKFNKSGNHYTWKKVTTTVHNIIVGKLWIDQVRSEIFVCHCGGCNYIIIIREILNAKVKNGLA